VRRRRVSSVNLCIKSPLQHFTVILGDGARPAFASHLLSPFLPTPSLTQSFYCCLLSLWVLVLVQVICNSLIKPSGVCDDSMVYIFFFFLLPVRLSLSLSLVYIRLAFLLTVFIGCQDQMLPHLSPPPPFHIANRRKYSGGAPKGKCVWRYKRTLENTEVSKESG
jgi:hypothetical protein